MVTVYPPHPRSEFERARDAVVEAAEMLMAARIPSTSTFEVGAVNLLDEALDALRQLHVDNDAWREERRAEHRATPTHLLAKPGDRKALCGDTSGLGGLMRFAGRWQSNGQTICGECLAAIPHTAVWDQEGVVTS